MKYINKIMLLMVLSFNVVAAPIGSSFNYQGLLNDNGAPANGLYDMRFRVYSVLTGNTNLGSIAIDDVAVTKGLFNVDLDFGDVVFSGEEVFLEISVTVANFPGYFLLSPRQRINTVPYAIQSVFAENGSSPWTDAFSGIQHNGDVVIGSLAADAGDTVQINSDTGDSPLRILVGTNGTKFRVSSNGGTAIGANATPPTNGLKVAGDANQNLTSHGFVKAGTFIQCGAGINGGSERFFNNVNGTDFTTTQNGAGGGCSITVPFSVDDLFYVVSAEHTGGPFISRNASCITHATLNNLVCQINELSSAGTTVSNGVLQILFY